MIWLAFLALGAVDARSPQEIYQDGVRAYLDRRFDDAEALFERIAGAGLHNADVEFNLGTCYAEGGQLGPAVLHLKRAELLRAAPDASANLQIVRERILEANPGRSRDSSLWVDIADGVVRWPLEPLCGGSFAALSLALLLAYVRRRPTSAFGKALVAVTGSAAVLSCSLFLVRALLHDARPPGVVMRSAAAKSGPDERFKTLQDLVAGDEVRLVAAAAATPGFTAVELGNGLTAYVTDGAVSAVKDWQ